MFRLQSISGNADATGGGVNRGRPIINGRRQTFYDLQIRTMTLGETEQKLADSMNTIKGLRQLNMQLTKDIDNMRDKHTQAQIKITDVLWNYFPSASADFVFIPPFNPDIIESQQLVDVYRIDKILNGGQLSQVLHCVKANTKGPTTRFLKPGSPSTYDTKTIYLPMGEYVAIKRLDKSEMSSIEQVFRVEGEIKALTILSGHPNIVRYHYADHGRRNIYIIMESMPTDLFEFQNHYRTKMHSFVPGYILHELLKACEHLEANGICHRDIKPENVLIAMTRNEFIVKLCDFDLCAFVNDGDGSKNTQLTDFNGSPGFFAPETLLQSSYCGFKSDAFSVGCIALEMLLSPTWFNDEWIGAYEVLNTNQAPDFGRSMRYALRSAFAELQDQYHGNTVAFAKAGTASKASKVNFLSHNHSEEGLGSDRGFAYISHATGNSKVLQSTSLPGSVNSSPRVRFRKGFGGSVSAPVSPKGSRPTSPTPYKMDDRITLKNNVLSISCAKLGSKRILKRSSGQETPTLHKGQERFVATDSRVRGLCDSESSFNADYGQQVVDFVKAALQWQPYARASASLLRANLWIVKSTKLKALAVLHRNGNQGSTVSIPAPTIVATPSVVVCNPSFPSTAAADSLPRVSSASQLCPKNPSGALLPGGNNSTALQPVSQIRRLRGNPAGSVAIAASVHVRMAGSVCLKESGSDEESEDKAGALVHPPLSTREDIRNKVCDELASRGRFLVGSTPLGVSARKGESRDSSPGSHVDAPPNTCEALSLVNATATDEVVKMNEIPGTQDTTPLRYSGEISDDQVEPLPKAPKLMGVSPTFNKHPMYSPTAMLTALTLAGVAVVGKEVENESIDAHSQAPTDLQIAQARSRIPELNTVPDSPFGSLLSSAPTGADCDSTDDRLLDSHDMDLDAVELASPSLMSEISALTSPSAVSKSATPSLSPRTVSPMSHAFPVLVHTSHGKFAQPMHERCNLNQRTREPSRMTHCMETKQVDSVQCQEALYTKQGDEMAPLLSNTITPISFSSVMRAHAPGLTVYNTVRGSFSTAASSLGNGAGPLDKPWLERSDAMTLGICSEEDSNAIDAEEDEEDEEDEEEEHTQRGERSLSTSWTRQCSSPSQLLCLSNEDSCESSLLEPSSNQPAETHLNQQTLHAPTVQVNRVASPSPEEIAMTAALRGEREVICFNYGKRQSPLTVETDLCAYTQSKSLEKHSTKIISEASRHVSNTGVHTPSIVGSTLSMSSRIGTNDKVKRAFNGNIHDKGPKAHKPQLQISSPKIPTNSRCHSKNGATVPVSPYLTTEPHKHMRSLTWDKTFTRISGNSKKRFPSPSGK